MYRYEVYNEKGRILEDGTLSRVAEYTNYNTKTVQEWVQRMEEDPDLLTPDGYYLMRVDKPRNAEWY